MRVDDLPAEELRQEVAAALLGPEGRDCPHISRVSWLTSLIGIMREPKVADAMASIGGDPDPESVAMMRQEIEDLHTALLRLVEEPRQAQARQVAIPADIADAMEQIPF